ncbi:PREDICTED: reversion-inducing cysteine-rich protein with Kazal motifs-like, partial [Priapulus caudatus]|uniref:Reversion-inducing cysteine-rich protein with Kazal motifs-like n=1 Tax=Priapulus caudatus TaxID=37621 RepID=A0ABM1F6D9_PRICU
MIFLLWSQTFSTGFTQSWQEFDAHCRYQPSELPLISCLDDVDEPCELGCSGLSYCTNFNDRPTELYRSCNRRADAAARNDIMLWRNGTINHRMLLMNIPVLDIGRCEPQLWKAIACMLQVKPCNTRTYTNPIC